MKRILMLATLATLLVAVPFAAASAGKPPPRHAKIVHSTTAKAAKAKARAAKARHKPAPAPARPSATTTTAPAATPADDDQCDALTGVAHDQCEGELGDDDQCDALTG